MSPRSRKRTLLVLLRAAHVLTSVAWIGAVAAFLAVAAFGLAGHAVRQAGVYAALDVLMWAVIIPAAIASLVTGIAYSVLTSWGLLRHWWVLIKLVMTVVSTALLLLHTRVTASAAVAALHGSHDLAPLQTQLVVDSAAAPVVLLVVALLGFIRPQGRTPWAFTRARAT